jgi:gamma-glutamyltranspeptidase/glutathione hydrolase
MPVLARNVVATSQPLAAQAGLGMLAAGGNAVDAALAAAIALTVVEPTSNGIGSDAFALVWAGGGLHGLNASGRSPRGLPADHFAGKQQVGVLGWDGVTVPGAVSGWVALSKRFGAMTFEKLFEPAIAYAANGFLVSPQTAWAWDRGHERYRDFEAYQRTFCPGGRAPRAGERFASPDHAATLRLIAATGLTLHEIPPNGQGLAALLMLGIVDQHGLREQPADSARSLHFQIEAMKLAFADAHRYIADPASMDVNVDALLDREYLAQRASLVDPDRAGNPDHGVPRPGGTVYLTAADAEGTMVSFIQSNYTGFGSGVVIPGTGIAMQNRGACFTLEKGHPNEAAPGKRPYHTIIPGFMGGLMQPQGHAQVLIRIADYGQNPQAALDAPRWRIDGGLEVAIEPGFEPRVYDELRAMGHVVKVADARTVDHGRGQIAYRLEGGYLAASDLRSDGQAVGF